MRDHAAAGVSGCRARLQRKKLMTFVEDGGSSEV